MVKVVNIRRGFATNSSSSHSIVILPEGQKASDFSDNSEDGSFGWDAFTLATPEAKNRYVAAQYDGNFDSEHGYVDHQSSWKSDSTYGAEGFHFTDRVTGETIASPESRAFMERLLRHPRVLVLGGNDNGGEHPLEETLLAQGSKSLDRRHYQRVLDPKGHVTFFNTGTGDKIRVVLSDEEQEIMTRKVKVPNKHDVEKGTWPELVDIKITDFCPYGCTYCYQGSTPEGVHAPLELLQRLAEKFKRSGVMEVALGGGEPTLHPQFEEIVNTLAAAGVVVNVTSRNVAYWRKRREMELADRDALTAWYKARSEKLGIHREPDIDQPSPLTPRLAIKAVAFSVDTAEDVRKIEAALPTVYDSFQVHFQVVAGAVSLDEFERLMDAVGVERLTLLGYKTTGRGAQAMKSLPVFDSPNQHGYITAWARRADAQRTFNVELRDWRRREDEEERRLDDAYGRFGRDYKKIDAQMKKWREANPPPVLRTAPQLAIDTTLANVCQPELDALGVLPVTYAVTEGAFSAYIDAVDETLGPCSYTPDRMRPLEVERLWEDYAEMAPVGG